MKVTVGEIEFKNELICKREVESQLCYTYDYHGVSEGGINWESGTDIYLWIYVSV